MPRERSGRCPGDVPQERGAGSPLPRVREWGSLWPLPCSPSPGAGQRGVLCWSAATRVSREGVSVSVVELGAWLWQVSTAGPPAPRELWARFGCGHVADRGFICTCSGFTEGMKRFGS